MANGTTFTAWLKRTALLGVELRPGELSSVLGMFASLFLILFTAYLLKPAREMLILTEGTAEIRSYAVAAQALFLLFFIPVYGRLSRGFDTRRYMQIVTLAFVAILVAFAAAGKAGLSVSVAYFVWMGVYGVMVVAQFWAFASNLYNREAGERLFVIVALGASLGAWVGSAVARELVNHFDAYGLILAGAGVLFLSLIPAHWAAGRIPASSQGGEDQAKSEPSLLAGFKLVLSRRYLLLLAAFVILINLVNTTGEYLLAAFLEADYARESAAGAVTVSKSSYVGAFYSLFYFTVNLAGVLIQYFVVSRLLRFAGFAVAFAFTPAIVFLGYSALLVLPAIALFRYYKIVENSLDYSLQNTMRQMLYLPLSRQEKYEARAVIDSFGVRLGDLLQAGLVFVGLNWLAMEAVNFVPVAAVMAAGSLTVAMLILRERKQLLADQESAERAQSDTISEAEP